MISSHHQFHFRNKHTTNKKESSSRSIMCFFFCCCSSFLTLLHITSLRYVRLVCVLKKENCWHWMKFDLNVSVCLVYVHYYYYWCVYTVYKRYVRCMKLIPYLHAVLLFAFLCDIEKIERTAYTLNKDWSLKQVMSRAYCVRCVHLRFGVRVYIFLFIKKQQQQHVNRLFTNAMNKTKRKQKR